MKPLAADALMDNVFCSLQSSLIVLISCNTHNHLVRQVFFFKNLPKMRIRDMTESPWLQNPMREMVKIPRAFVLSALVLESTGTPLNGFGFSSFLSLSFLLQFSWLHSWEMTPIKTLWGQSWLMYHWPQLLQDVAKLQFLSCLPSAPILSIAPQDLPLPGLRASLLEWP